MKNADRQRNAATTRAWLLSATLGMTLAGCVSLPPAANQPRPVATALAYPTDTTWGRLFAVSAAAHPGAARRNTASGDSGVSDEVVVSGFRILSIGVDGFLTRLEMIAGAERTLDLQYYIFRGDESGRLLTQALVRAADRGVEVRVLVDDGDTVNGDEQLFTIAAHPHIQIRVFNPFRYRGHLTAVRAVEYLFNHRRLDYRMHNKLLLADNAIALAGGRNIGDQYFQIDPSSQFADDDVFAGGPVVQRLSQTFDTFWNSPLAIPVGALGRVPAAGFGAGADRHAPLPADNRRRAGFDYQAKLDANQPLADLLIGKLPLTWADARVLFDSPDKRRVLQDGGAGAVLYTGVASPLAQVHSELLMVSPYVIPSRDQAELLQGLRARDVQVRILTNSLESAPELSAHAGYRHIRPTLLHEGVELHEVRARPGNAHGTGQSNRLTRFGNFGLHAKLYVFDRSSLFIGSMNWDQRSRHLNTELGLLIDSPPLAQQMADRFAAMTQPENAYWVQLRSPPVPNHADALTWHTADAGRPIDYTTEPARSRWQRFKVDALTLLPLDGEL